MVGGEKGEQKEGDFESKAGKNRKKTPDERGDD